MAEYIFIVSVAIMTILRIYRIRAACFIIRLIKQKDRLAMIVWLIKSGWNLKEAEDFVDSQS